MDQTVQIQIAEVTPRNGKKPPVIKDTFGQEYTITDGSLGMFQIGVQGTVAFWVNRGGYKVVSQWNNVELPKGQAAPAQQAPLYAPQQQPVHQPMHPNAVVNQPPAQTHQPHDDHSESIFVTGIVGRSMQSGSFTVTDIDMLTKAAVAAWRNRNNPTIVRTEGGMPDAPPANGPEDYGYNNLTAAG